MSGCCTVCWDSDHSELCPCHHPHLQVYWDYLTPDALLRLVFLMPGDTFRYFVKAFTHSEFSELPGYREALVKQACKQYSVYRWLSHRTSRGKVEAAFQARRALDPLVTHSSESVTQQAPLDEGKSLKPMTTNPLEVSPSTFTGFYTTDGDYGYEFSRMSS